jgi:beta-N-acetylhexosaminidase
MGIRAILSISPPGFRAFLAHGRETMTSTSTAIGLLAVAAQIGVPVQKGAPARGASGPIGVEAAVSAPAPEVSVRLPVEVGPAGVAGSGSGGGLWSRLEPEARAWVERTAAGLTLEEKAAQLVVAYLEGGRPSEGSARWRRARRLVEEERVGGFIVGVGSTYGTARWLNELQALSEQPLLVAADLEWGPGTRLEGATVLPINMAVAAAGEAGVAYEAGRITALEARAAGIHMAFAPVADVNVNPQNPVINTRSYGSDPGEVSRRVVEFIRGARSAGMMTVVKHFPGHGDTETDSHLAMPVLDVDRPRLDQVELTPFRAAIGAGVDGVMTAHLAVPALDPLPRLRPATLSPRILTDLLRVELGFDGLVVTDALHMDGVRRQGRSGDVAVAAVKAGADVLLIPPDEAEAIDALVRAVRRGELSEARLDRSVRRVLAAKAAAGLHAQRDVDTEDLRARVGLRDHEEWSRRVAERSITLARGERGSLPVAVEGRQVLAVIYNDRNHGSGGEFVAALAERGARVLTLQLSKSSGPGDLARARRLARSADVTLFASFSRAVPWKGSLGLPGPVTRLADELAAAGAPVFAFGDPYLLRQIPDARTYVLAWAGEPVNQRAAARALMGEIPITGRLPIDLPPAYRVGDGLLVPALPGITALPVD